MDERIKEQLQPVKHEQHWMAGSTYRLIIDNINIMIIFHITILLVSYSYCDEEPNTYLT